MVEDVTISDSTPTKREMNEIGILSSRAFYTDPFFVRLSPRPYLRSRGLAIYFQSICAHMGASRRLWIARLDGHVVGVAAWAAPGGYPYPVTDQLHQMVGSLRALAPRPPALVEGLKYMAALEKAHPKEPVWYLQLLACDPEHQRQGIGAKLQAAGLQLCDQQGLDAYLETQREDNLAYYRRFGYEVVDELRPVRGGPPLWTMRRTPRESGV